MTTLSWACPLMGKFHLTDGVGQLAGRHHQSDGISPSEDKPMTVSSSISKATDWLSDLRASAQVALSCLDLTSLNDNDTEADIARLCLRAQSPFGPVAAVCVWPRLAAVARAQLPGNIAVAAVANFPQGSS